MDWESQRNRSDIRTGGGSRSAERSFYLNQRHFEVDRRNNHNNGSGGSGFGYRRVHHHHQQQRQQGANDYNYRDQYQQNHNNRQRSERSHHHHHWTRPLSVARLDRKRKISEIEMDEDWEMSHECHALSLLDLPDEVGEQIFMNLDTASLLTLRRVSRTTKRWVDSRQVVNNLKIEVNNSKHLQQIVKSEVKFSNFAIKCMTFGSIFHMQDFQMKFGENIRVLQILTPKGWPRKVELLTASSRLEVLEMSDFIMDMEDSNSLSVEQFRLICRNSRNMKRFKLDSIVTTKVELSIAAFFTWISYMDQLDYLRVPKFVWSSNQMMPDEQSKESRTKNQDCFITKFREYLNHRQSNLPRSNLKILDVEEFVDYEGHQFQRLAEICAHFKIRMVNAASYFLKKALDLNPSYLWPVVESLSGFDPLLPFDNMTNLTKMSLNCFVPHDHLNLLMPEGYQIELPRLKTLVINIYGQDSLFMHSMLDVFLHRTSRPSVETLVINCHDTDSDNFIRSDLLAVNFKTVKKFELHNYKGNYIDYRIFFTVMTSLEDVTLKDCKQLTDQAFVTEVFGKVEPTSIAELKKLKRLTIRTYERGVTDLSFKFAFSRLSLRSFNFTCVGRPTITAAGFRSLATSPLRTTVQYLDVIKPQDLTDREYREVLLGFSNLIRRRQ